MSYYALNQGTNVYEAAAGLGAFVRTKDRYGTWIRQPRAERFRAQQPYSIPFSYAGLGAIEFSGAQGWADQTACDAAWQSTKTTVPQCKSWVNQMRAGLAALGYGVLSQGVSWGPEDIAAYKSWCSKNGLTPTTYPTKDGWTTMETQIKKGIVTGEQPPVEMVKSGETWVPSGVVGQATATKFDFFKLAMIAGAVIAVGALAIAAKRRSKKPAPPVSGPITASAPATVASPAVANPSKRRRLRHSKRYGRRAR